MLFRSPLPAGCDARREGDEFLIAYDPAKASMPQLLSALQRAGEIRGLTAQPQNIDHLIAAMYKELDL